LRKKFCHDPAKWEEFQKNYYEELQEDPEVLSPIVKALEKGPVTLLYSAKDEEHNNAVSLKKYLESHLSKIKKS
jgi:uncharacterized protein YeaO (DUF488 family)